MGKVKRGWVTDRGHSAIWRTLFEGQLPRRIQRMPLKGWRMPPNTAYVGHGSKWANPYSTSMFVRSGRNSMSRRLTAEEAVAKYRSDLPFILNTSHLDVSELRGKNLMCWCKIGKPCHADVLLELANGEPL